MKTSPVATPTSPTFWDAPAAELLTKLETAPTGLRSAEAAKRLLRYGPNTLRAGKRTDTLTLLLRQFKSPIILILVFAAVLSLVLKDRVDAGIILGIVAVSGLLSFWQERGANDAVEKLLAIVQVKATVLRDGKSTDIPIEKVVPGDVVLLNAGDVIPGDCLLLESNNLFADEATLTGETFPVEKQPGVLPAATSLAKRANSLFMGTHVVSGSATAVVVHTAKDTEFGQVSERLRLRAAETEFEHGVRRFGYFLGEVTLVLVIIIFGVNVYLHKPVLDSFLFSMALAVGLTPQLLPAIISINLAHGAKRMAQEKVIVKRLAAIENLGSMNVLCSDKTGTLTEGKVRLHAALDAGANDSERVLLFAYLNASFETGFANPIDVAIKSYKKLSVSGYKKLGEVPYDFLRKRLSILVSQGDARFMVTKGTLVDVLAVCSHVERPPAGSKKAAAATAVGSQAAPAALTAPAEARVSSLSAVRRQIQAHYAALSAEGYRVLGIAYRDLPSAKDISRDDEKDMTFLGFLVFFDPPKAGIVKTLKDLRQLGVSVKMITGDNALVAASVGEQVGLSGAKVATAKDLHALSDEALRARVNSIDIFAEIEPNQK